MSNPIAKAVTRLRNKIKPSKKVYKRNEKEICKTITEETKHTKN